MQPDNIPKPMAISRRQFLTLAGVGVAGASLASPLQNFLTRSANGQAVRTTGYGPLAKDPQGILELPAGFQYRIFSRTGDQMSDGTQVPSHHDGMAAFAGPKNTTILVRNHELSPGSRYPVIANRRYDPLGAGGTTTLIVNAERKLVRDYVSLAGTVRNCAGGPTPWGSWLTCEENVSTPAQNLLGNPLNVEAAHGYVFEVPAAATGPVEPIPLKAMGRFYHEAVAVDPRTGIVYQTEDRIDGRFYRFIPTQSGKLAAGGGLEALRIKDQPQVNTTSGFPIGKPVAVEWVKIDDPDPAEDSVRGQAFSKGAAQFTRGEGIVYSKGEIYFTCTNGGAKGAGQVWRYIPGATALEGGTLELFIESPDPDILDFPDNLIVAPTGDLLICEDGTAGNNLVGITPKGQLYTFGRNVLNASEFAGICFSPDSQTMFVNIQDPGMTLAIWGPWAKV
jgi:secreted PhoX family phosphatase